MIIIIIVVIVVVVVVVVLIIVVVAVVGGGVVGGGAKVQVVVVRYIWMLRVQPRWAAWCRLPASGFGSQNARAPAFMKRFT